MRHTNITIKERTQTMIEWCEEYDISYDCMKMRYRRGKRGEELIKPITEYKHYTDLKEYSCWTGMKNRCYNPNEKCYKNYGGRGITVSDEWRDSFINFYNDMGNKPKGYELDRIDNSKGYSKENCRWIDRKTNQRNKRNIQPVTINGETKLLVDWSKEYGIKYSTIRTRYYRGLRGEDLIK